MKKEVFAQLQKNLKEKIALKGLSITQMNKLLNIRNNKYGVSSIIYGAIQHPKEEVLKRIAEILDCELTDLVPQEHIKTLTVVKSYYRAPKNSHTRDFIDNLSLYSTIAAYVPEAIMQRNCDIDVTATQISSITLDCYKYLDDKGESNVDKHFCNWLIEKTLL